jgi:hypothetical protein
MKILIGVAVSFCLSFSIVSADDVGHTPDLHVDSGLEECEIHLSPLLTQGQFKKFSREVGLILSFKSLSSAESLGSGKWDIGVDFAYTPIDDSDPSWNNTFSHPDDEHYLGNSISFPFVHARLGVTDELDVGAYFTTNPTSNFAFLGLETKYAFMKESGRKPSAAVRATYATLLRVDDVQLNTFGLDFTFSKKWGRFTPYVGISGSYTIGQEKTDFLDLDTERVWASSNIIGTEFAIGFLKLAAEYNFADVSTFSFKTGFNF